MSGRTTPPTLPAELRSRAVTREQFITVQHYKAWKAWTPLRRHLANRKKLDRDFKDHFFRHHAYRCVLCGATAMLTVDHIVPQILGGSSNDCNCRGLCLPCNQRAWQPFDRYLRQLDAYLKAVA